MDHATAIEIDRLRQDSRQSLEQAWARTEQLQAEGYEISQRLAELEAKLAQVKQESCMEDDSMLSPSQGRQELAEESINTFATGPSNTDNRNMITQQFGDSESNRFLIENSSINQMDLLLASRASISSRPSRRGSGGSIASSVSCRDSFSPQLGRQMMMLRGSYGGGMEVEIHATPTQPVEHDLMSATGNLGESAEQRRINLMLIERAKKVQELTQKLEEKEEELRQMQNETNRQQQVIHELNADLEALEAPQRLISMLREVSETEQKIQEMEREIKSSLSKLSTEQETHLALENEWYELEDTVADAETITASKLDNLNTKLSKFRDESDPKDEKRNFLLLSARESLEGMRQDLMDHLPPAVCTTMIKTLQGQMESLVRNEKELSSFLISRISERASLLIPKRNVENMETKCSNMLDRVNEILEKIDSIEGLHPASDVPDSLVAVNQLEHLTQQITENLLNMQDALNSRTIAIEDGFILEPADNIMRMTLDSERLSYSIAAKVRQVEGSLPNAINQHGAIDIAVNNQVIKDFEERIQKQRENLELFVTELGSLEHTLSIDSEKSKAAKMEIEGELKFMKFGLSEKDRMIKAIETMITQRESSEMELIEEVKDLLIRGEITEQLIRMTLDTYDAV